MYQTHSPGVVRRIADGALIRADGELPATLEYLRWIAAGNEPTPAPDPADIVPQSVTPVQAFTALDQVGKLAPLMAYIDAPTTPPLVRATALGATEWRRDSLMLMAVAIVLGLSQAEVDDLFVTAAQIKV